MTIQIRYTSLQSPIKSFCARLLRLRDSKSLKSSKRKKGRYKRHNMLEKENWEKLSWPARRWKRRCVWPRMREMKMRGSWPSSRSRRAIVNGTTFASSRSISTFESIKLMIRFREMSSSGKSSYWVNPQTRIIPGRRSKSITWSSPKSPRTPSATSFDQVLVLSFAKRASYSTATNSSWTRPSS